MATNEEVLDQIDRANIAWAQAGIRVKMVDGPIIEAAPKDEAGVGILHDGWFAFWNPASLNPLEPFADVRASIEALGAQATPGLLEVVFTGPLPGSFGWTSNPSGHGVLAAGLQNNTYVFMGPNLDIRNRTLAHEVGHALTNQTDAAPIPYIFTPYQPDEEFPLPGDDSVPWQQRRLRHDTEANARTLRDPGCLHCVGNLLLRPEGNEEGTP